MSEGNLFSIPRRLDSLGYIINILKTFLRFMKQFAFVIAFILYKQRDILSSTYLWLIILGLVVVIAIISFLNFQSFKYYVNLETNEFILEQGIFNTSKIVIKFTNILQVNISQNILQKMLSLYGLTLDTAGSDKVEVNLYALNGNHAAALKKLLLSKIDSHGSALEMVSADNDFLKSSAKETYFSLPSRNILLVSLFSNYRQGLALFFAFLLSMFNHFKEAVDTFELKDDIITTSSLRELVNDAMFSSILMVILLLITIPFFINIVRYYFKYYNFTIVKNVNFSMQYGLFKHVNTIFNQDKVQLTIFKQNKILKRLGIGILSLKQLVNDVAKEDKSSIEIPGLSVDDRNKVYELAFGKELFVDQEIIKPSIGLFVNRMLKMSVLFLAIGTLCFLLDIGNSFVYLSIAVLFVLSFFYYYLYYKNCFLIFNSAFIIKRFGVWNEKEIIIPMNRIQGLEVSQTIFQKQANTASLHLFTAAKTIHFPFFAQKEVNQMVNYMLYVIEK